MKEATTYVFKRRADLLHITGADRVDLLHRLSTQDLRPLHSPGRACQTLFTTQQGKLVDWTFLYSLQDALWLLASSGRIGEVKAWIEKFTIMEDVVATDISDDYEEVRLVGPASAALAGLVDMPAEGTFVARDGGVLSPGLAAFGLNVRASLPKDAAAKLYQAAQGAGAAVADAATQEDMRLQAGIPSAAFEFSEQVNPLELRLTKHAVGWNKGCYIGQEVISRLDTYDKVARVLMGFTSEVPLPEQTPGQPYKVSADGKPLGRVTSWAPHDGGVSGLAMVKREAAQTMAVTIHGGHDAVVPAQLVLRPFFS